MRYNKTISGNYILSIGTGGSGVEITKAEYETIQSVIESKPPRTETTDYRLRTDLTWEVYERPPEPPEDPDAEAADYEAALARLGVET